MQRSLREVGGGVRHLCRQVAVAAGRSTPTSTTSTAACCRSRRRPPSVPRWSPPSGAGVRAPGGAALRAPVDRPDAGAVARDPLEDPRRADRRALSLSAVGGRLFARRRSRPARLACACGARAAPRTGRSVGADPARRRACHRLAQSGLARRRRAVGGHRGEEPGVGHGGAQPRHRLPAGRALRRGPRRLRARPGAPQHAARSADDPQQPRHAGDVRPRLRRGAAPLRGGAGRPIRPPRTACSTSASPSRRAAAATPEAARRALPYFLRARAINPHDPDVEAGLGQMYVIMGDASAARAHLQRALELGPDARMVDSVHKLLARLDAESSAR